MVKRLHRLARKCRADKIKHPHFMLIYEAYFLPLKEKKLKILELGVKNGGSLRMWKRYFPNAKIFGVDNKKYCRKSEENRIKIFIGNSINKEFLKNVVEETGFLDIIIDDGAHRAGYPEAAFRSLFPFLKPGGIYVIEDLHVAYIERLLGGLNREGTSIEFLKKIVDSLYKEYHGEIIIEENIDDTIESVDFYKGICFINKKLSSGEDDG